MNREKVLINVHENKTDENTAKNPVAEFVFRFEYWHSCIFKNGSAKSFWFFLSCCDTENTPWDNFLCRLNFAEILSGTSENVTIGLLLKNKKYR